jgi:hypothetical protein
VGSLVGRSVDHGDLCSGHHISSVISYYAHDRSSSCLGKQNLIASHKAEDEESREERADEPRKPYFEDSAHKSSRKGPAGAVAFVAYSIRARR